ncbi:MAG: lytic transglycosylase, partial [Desulfurobacterium sp.]
NKRSCKTLLDIPWDKPAFQFWLSYYKNRWNKLKLLSQIDSFKVFYPKIVEIFREEGIPEDLALLSIVESQGNPSAVSKAGAAGLWQLMPSTARRLGLKVNWLIDERFDPIKSTKAAAKYLKELYSIFRRWDLAIAAYNAGPGRIQHRLKKLGDADFWDLTKLPDETLNYVPKFYAVLSFIKSSNLLKEERPEEKLVKVKVLSRTSLYRISKKLHVPYGIAKRFNLQFRRRIVPAGHYVYIPIKYVKKTDLVRYIKSARVYVYVPKRRERVSTIARRFGVDASTIKELNHLRRNVVYRGQTLLIVKREEKGRVTDGSS